MAQINIQEAKAQFSKLINRVLDGEEIVIAKAGRPAVKLIAVGPEKKNRVPGSAEGLIQISDDFDAPLPDEVLSDFEQ